jgi:excisionase family DNA binding protein
MTKLLTVKEVQELLNVSRFTVYRWRQQGMPYTQIKGSVRFDIDQVNAWIEEQQKQK